MSGQLGDLVVSLSADIARFQSDMGKAVKISQDNALSMTHAFEGVTGAIGKIGTVMTAVAAGAGFAKMINDAADWNISAMKMANTMGITSQQSSVMAVALHSLGIENDVATNAALKLSKTLATGTDKFDQFGITVKDSNGNLLPMTEIMANVNSKLLETATGADRNIMAMTLYGRTWKDLQPILRLTKESMEEAKETAERLHLIVGQDGIDKALAYKKSVHEVELVGHSLAVQLGNELMPIVIDLGTAFGDTAVSGVGFFGKVIHETLSGLYQLRDALQLDTRKVMRFPGFFDKDALKEWKAENDADEALYSHGLESLAAKMGGLTTPIVKARTRTKQLDRIDPSMLGTGADEDQKHFENYLRKMAELNKNIADANPYLTEYEKKMAGVYSTVDKLSTEFPEYIKSWNKYGEAMQHNIDLTELLKTTTEEHDDYLLGDKHQNYLGQMGQQRSLQPDGSWKSQQDRFDASAQTADWAAKSQTAQENDLLKTKEFAALRAEIGYDSTKMQLVQIEKEQKAWEESWAMDTASFEENQQRMQQIAEVFAAKREQLTDAGKVTHALQEYAKAATDTGTQIGNAMTSGLKSMEDALVSFAMTGKLNFKSLADSIISNMIRIAIQQSITGPLANKTGDWLGLAFKGVGALFGGASSASSSGSSGSSGSFGVLASDANTGAGWSPPSYAVGTDFVPNTGPAILHKGEAVIPAIQNRGGTGGGSVTIHQSFQITGVGADIMQNTKAVAKQAADQAKNEIYASMERGGKFALASGRMK
jgi:lambda family phage tail tape measure protein